MVKFKLIDVGRGNFNGEVNAQTGHPEHVEASILLEAQKHLGSRDVHIQGDNYEGFIYAGTRAVGRYERCDME